MFTSFEHLLNFIVVHELLDFRAHSVREHSVLQALLQDLGSLEHEEHWDFHFCDGIHHKALENREPVKHIQVQENFRCFVN